MTEDNATKVAMLVNYIGGRGYPTQIGEEDKMVELEIMKIVRSLTPSKMSPKEAHDLLAGNWRLVFTTSEQLSNLSSIMGGPMKVGFESIGDDSVHIAAPFKGLFLMFLAPLLLVFCLVFAVTNQLSFLSAFFVTNLVFSLAAKYGPSGLFASRRVGFSVKEGLIATSRLDRDVLAVFASQFAFDKKAIDPMVSFCKAFDSSNGTKDPLKAGFLFGWRLVPRPFCLHLKSHETIRKEQVAYIDENVRIMIGGDVIVTDGTMAASAVSIFVRI